MNQVGLPVSLAPLNVLVITVHSYPGDSPSANLIQRLSRGIRADGHSVYVISPRQPGDGYPLIGEDQYGTPYSSYALPSKPRYVPYYVYVTLAQRSRGVPLVEEVLSAGSWDAAIIDGFSWSALDPVRKRCQDHGTAFIPYALELFMPSLTRVLGMSWFDNVLFRRLTYPRSDGLIAISRFWTAEADRLGLPSVLVPSFNKFAEAELPPVVRNEGGGRFQLMFVGRWAARELPRTLIRGVDLALARGVDLELVVTGRVGTRIDERPAMRFFESMPRVKERTTFLGWVDDAALRHRMSRADAFVLLRDDSVETRALFPTRLPEYLATGNPVIVSDAGDLGHYLEHGRSAWVLPPGDRPEALADALVALSSDRPLAQAIGAAGREVLLRAFSQELLGRRAAEFLARFRAGTPALAQVGA